MKQFRLFFMFIFLVTTAGLQATAQNPKDSILTPAYLSGTWVVRHVDTVFGHKQELKMKFYGKNNFEQWMVMDGKINDMHKGSYKIKNNTIIFIDKKGRENLFLVVQLSVMYLRLKEKAARDIITFMRE